LAGALGILGSIDINRGDYLLGWDTDQFAMNIPEMALACYYIFRDGGNLGTGGFNFDAKIRRQSIDPDDLLEAHVASMDACARGLLIAEKIITDGKLDGFIAERYAGWDGKEGKAILAGKRSLDDLSDYVLKKGLDPQPKSGKQEHLERLLNDYL
ncbi:MAG: xylose isomerase, partial [Rhizobiales bacterium]|nr:xylose isomerase [Hyphomicrobiales bacterium]